MQRALSPSTEFPSQSPFCPKGPLGSHGLPGDIGSRGSRGDAGFTGHPGPRGKDTCLNGCVLMN